MIRFVLQKNSLKIPIFEESSKCEKKKKAWKREKNTIIKKIAIGGYLSNVAHQTSISNITEVCTWVHIDNNHKRDDENEREVFIQSS